MRCFGSAGSRKYSPRARRCSRVCRSSARRCSSLPSSSVSSGESLRHSRHSRHSSGIIRASAACTRSAAAASSSCGRPPQAIEAFLVAVNINHALPGSWSMLEGLYRLTGQADEVATAGESGGDAAQPSARHRDGDGAVRRRRLDAAESLVRSWLIRARRSHRGDAAARAHRDCAQGLRRCRRCCSRRCSSRRRTIAPHAANTPRYSSRCTARGGAPSARRLQRTARTAGIRMAAATMLRGQRGGARRARARRRAIPLAPLRQGRGGCRGASVDRSRAEDRGQRSRPSKPITGPRSVGRTSAMPTGASPISRLTASRIRSLLRSGRRSLRPRPDLSTGIIFASRWPRRSRTAASSPSRSATTSSAIG